jgi:uncharacterized protein DUF779
METRQQQVEQVVATGSALDLIKAIAADHGPVMFHQSGGRCDGSAPMCYPEGTSSSATGTSCSGRGRVRRQRWFAREEPSGSRGEGKLVAEFARSQERAP